MIQEYNQGLEDVLSHNDTMMKTKEIGEDIQSQEESWREKERIRKAQ